MSDIYQLGTHTHKKVDSKGREEEWSWEVTPDTIIALQTYWARVRENK